MVKSNNKPHDSINPALIAALTHQPESAISLYPSVDMLPGKWAARVRDASMKRSAPLLRNKPNWHTLVCRSCGQQDRYNMGSILIDPDQWKNGLAGIDQSDEDAIHGHFLQCMSFTRYFRCSHCNRAAGWDLDPRTMEIEFARHMEQQSGLNPENVDEKYRWGVMQSSNETLFRSTMDFETYYLSLLANDLHSPMLWFQLGSVYANGERPELAAASFERSLRLDRTHTEAYVSMGFLLMKANLMSEAAIHFHLALISAHQYSNMEALELRVLLERAIMALTAIHGKSKQRIPLLPTDETYQQYFSDEEQYERYDERLSTVDMVEVSTSHPETITRLAEFFMWGQADRLPEDKRLLNSGEPFGLTDPSAMPRPLSSGLGSNARPIMLRVFSPRQSDLAVTLCDAFGWKYVLELGGKEDFSDMVKALKELHGPASPYAPCPCGSGEKFKFCCYQKMRKMTDSEIMYHFLKQYDLQPVTDYHASKQDK